MSSQSKKKASKNSLLEKENEILKEEQKFEKKEQKLMKEEQKVEELAEQELEELKKLEKIETDIQKNTKSNPFKYITYRDFTKGFVGSFFGIMGHFSFYYGKEISADISLTQANLLFIFGLLVLIGFMYFAGFKKAPEKKYLKYSIFRIFILFCVSIISVIIVLLLFGFIHAPYHFMEIYKMVATICPLAVIGAGTADLIGGRRE